MLLIGAFNLSFLTSCDTNDFFDMSDEQEYWVEQPLEKSDDDRIRIVFKKTKADIYPELTLDDLKFENAERIEYINLRPNYALTSLSEDYLDNFRQIADVYLKEKGCDKVLEAIKYFEKQPYVKLVRDVYNTLDPPTNENTPQIDEFVSIDNVSMLFDVTEENAYWSGTIDEDFREDRIEIVFKRTYTYSEIDVEDLNFPNAESIVYQSSHPVKDIDEYSVDYLIFRYRQIAEVYLKETGKDKVIEAVEYFRTLDFIKHAGPSYDFEIGYDSV